MSATSTETVTVAEAAKPILVTAGMPTTASPASAMMTVRPANTTADPAVPVAILAACSGSRPRARSSR